MKKFLKYIGLCTCACILAFISVLFFMRLDNRYLPGQTVNGVNVGGKTAHTVWQEMLMLYPTDVMLAYDGGTVTVPDVLSYPYDYLLTHTVEDWLKRTPITVDMTPEISDTLLVALLELEKEAVDAKIIVDAENEFAIIPEELGYSFDYTKIKADIIAGVSPIDLSEYQVLPVVTKDSLFETYLDLNWINDFEISYSMNMCINKETLLPMVDMENLTFTLDEDVIDVFIEQIANAYCTEYEYYYFTPTGEDKPKSIPRGKRGTLGKVVKKQAEKEFILDCIKSRTSYRDRIPEMAGKDEFEDTYIEISIDQQHLWYYKDGELVSETDVVTGRKGKHDTPCGVYYISECVPGKYLIGDDYKTWVNYWMRLTNSGIGLHDASWRSKFGDSIYTYDGSHGCINLPKKYAKEFYEEAYVGMPVVIY